MANRSRDWFAQAERDLAHAGHAARDGSHEWACFASQQAAEKAVKALHLWLGQEAWGHTISELLELLPIDASHLVEKGRVLDNYYVATRYANGHPDGAPYEHYGPLQSDGAIAYAGEIVAFVRARLAEPAAG
jgi:HEPN domain-containing protein